MRELQELQRAPVRVWGVRQRFRHRMEVYRWVTQIGSARNDVEMLEGVAAVCKTHIAGTKEEDLHLYCEGCLRQAQKKKLRYGRHTMNGDRGLVLLR